jgi:hypothetical protein
MTALASDAVEWAKFGFQVFAWAVSMAISVVTFMIMGQFVHGLWAFYTEGRGGPPPTFRVLLRRIYCRHRSLSRVKNRYGHRQTLCSECGKDVHKNRQWEMRR